MLVNIRQGAEEDDEDEDDDDDDEDDDSESGLSELLRDHGRVVGRARLVLVFTGTEGKHVGLVSVRLGCSGSDRFW